jgi:hypothetical protein
MAINVPINTGGTILTQGNSITGSFGGLLALSTGSILTTSGSQIISLKYINGTNASGYPVEATISTVFNLTPGTKLELVITSCSLAAISAPVFLYY